MPDFGPLLRGVAPMICGVLLFVALINFVVFVVRRWKSNP